MLRNKFKILLWSASIVYFGALTKLILFKTKIGSVDYDYMDDYNFTTNLKATNLVPIKGIVSIFGSGNSFIFIFQNIAGNIILFVPLGILVYFTSNSSTSKKAFKTALLTSLFYEVVQLTFVLGHFDIDDLILNSLGGVLGFYTAKILAVIYHLPNAQKQLA